MNKKGTNNKTLITYLLVILMIICEIYRLKNIFIEPNNVLETSISNLLYPFTFLLIILIYKNSNFKETHKSIIKTSIVFLIFILLTTILNNIPSNYYSKSIDGLLKQILTPNKVLISNRLFYYPNLLDAITYTLLFYFSHTLILILYEAMEPYTRKFIAYSLSMFIPFTLDTICYIAINDMFKEIEFNNMINHLTAGFVIVIISTILTTIIYSIYTKKVSFKS